MLKITAGKLGVDPDALYNLIKFESGWNPTIKNPRSSARGLIQFTDSTARNLGFLDSLDLVKKHPTVAEQLPVVERYLKQFTPFKNRQSLYMSVFYPAARSWNAFKKFPQYVIDDNPGVNTPDDYINLVDGTTRREGAGVVLVLIGIAYLLVKYLDRKGIL